MTNGVQQKHLIIWLIIPTILAAVSGCAQFAGNKPPAQSVRAQQALNASPKITYLAELAAELRTMSPADIKNRAAALETVYEQDKSEENRVRYGAFLAMAPAPAGDRNRAFILLNTSPGPAQSGRNHPVAAVLLPALQEIITLRDTQNKNQQKLRDEQKRNDSLQEKNYALQKKIDALSNIEKQMLERTPVRPRK